MKNKQAYTLLGIGLLLQIVSFVLIGDTWLSFLSSVCGVVAVVSCSERKIGYYLWSIAQMITFTIICWNTHLYGKLFENSINLIIMIVGLYSWSKNIDSNRKVKTKSLNVDGIVKCIIGSMTLWCVLFVVLSYFGGKYPLLDSITTTLGLVAQILVIYRYRESWILWIIVDIICIFIWSIEGNWCIVTRYLFWMINAGYGYVNWTNNKE